MADMIARLVPDRYTVQARLLPAFLLLLPLGIAATAFEPLAAVGLPGGAGLAIVVLILLAGRVRTAGRAVQEQLWAIDGAPPSTRALRWDSEVPPDVQQRRHHLTQTITSVRLPDVEQEAAEPEAADRAYTEAIHGLIERTRDHRVLLVENVTYGMWRNLYGVRPTGIILTVTAAVLTTIATITGTIDPTAAAMPLLIDTVLLAVWTAGVTLDQVRIAQQIYVEQLFKAAETAQPA